MEDVGFLLLLVSPYVFETGALTEPKAAVSARLAARQAPGIYLSYPQPPVQVLWVHVTMLGFYVGAEDLNSGPWPSQLTHGATSSLDPEKRNFSSVKIMPSEFPIWEHISFRMRGLPDKL